MDLHRMSYDNICQIELLHAAAAAAATNNKMQQQQQQTAPNANAASNVGTQASQAATMLPIMVIPTSMMPPGTIFTTTTSTGNYGEGGDVGVANSNPTAMGIDGSGNGNGNGGGLCEHQFYQLQPTHILTTTVPTTTTMAGAPANNKQQNELMTISSVGDGNGGNGMLGSTISLMGGITKTPPNATIMMAASNVATLSKKHEQHPYTQSQQIPQTTLLGGAATMCAVSCSPNDALLNMICAGGGGGNNTLLKQKSFESATQPGAYVKSALANNCVALQHDESDFEGSECGASISTTTCIPPFRFGGCGMILQPTAAAAAAATACAHQQENSSHDTPSVIGCGALSHMMGSFAAAAGVGTGARHGASGRLTVGGTGTLGRYRRSATAAQTAQTPKRVSFRADTMPPSHADDIHQQLFDVDANELRLVHRHNAATQAAAAASAGTLSSCAYMHCENPMDYQTTGFGGLPDVTEHSNIRRTLSRQSSICNSSDQGAEIIVGIQKSKENFAERIKLSTTSSGGIVGIEGDSPNFNGRLSKQQKKLKAAHKSAGSSGSRSNSSGGRRSGLMKSDKNRRGPYAIGLTLIAALSLAVILALLTYQYLFMAPSRNSLTQRLKIVSRILRDVPLVDGNNNFAWNVRKYGHSSLELVHVQQNLNQKNIWTRPTWAQTDMERLKQGLVGVQVWSAYVPCKAQGLDAVQLALEQIDIIRRFADMFADKTTLITSSKEILLARRRGLMASLIGIEGGHSIGASMGVLRSLYSLGARFLTLTHRCDVPWASSSSSARASTSSATTSASSSSSSSSAMLTTPAQTAQTLTTTTQTSHGLSSFGKAIVREMNRLGMMIDLSHSSDMTARDVLQVTRAPVIFSHSAARSLCNSTRNVPDDILRLVAENGGLIMVSFDPEDVACDNNGGGGSNGRQANLHDVAQHINYIRSIAGIQHIGLGAGYDGIKMPPTGLEDVSKYPNLLAALLEDPNWSEEDIAMLAGKNFLRIMETVENVRDYWKRAEIQPTEQTEASQPKTQCTYMSS